VTTLRHIALVGRPNVGKSTLFNRLTATRDALVADMPGLTRDRQYGIARIEEHAFSLIDTGGLVGGDFEPSMRALMTGQVRQALDESDLALFLVDLRDGVTPDDHEIAALLRRQGRPVLLVANKADGVRMEERLDELFELGFGEAVPISAAHNRGIGQLGDAILAALPPVPVLPDEEGADPTDRGITVAIVGRPNVGKSTLVNRLLGEDRVIVFDAPGTTRDSIFVPFERDGERFTLIDTAGVRRRGRVDEMIEKFSVAKTLEAMHRADVVVLVLDARESIVEQDLRLLGFAIEAGRSIVLAINKWDGLRSDERDAVRTDLDRRLDFAPWVEQQFISALHGSGVGELIERVRDIHLSARIRFSAGELTTMLERLLEAHSPPLVHGRRIKLRFAHSGGDSPPTVVIHGNQTDAVPPSYKRYLEHGFRAMLGLRGSALRISFRTGENPYANQRNELNARQRKRRERMIAHDRSRDHKGRGKR
jgi:GTP-binding protein